VRVGESMLRKIASCVAKVLRRTREGHGVPTNVVGWLAQRDFTLAGVFNANYDDRGRAIPADFLFTRC